jgi:hypothetical protein
MGTGEMEIVVARSAPNLMVGRSLSRHLSLDPLNRAGPDAKPSRYLVHAWRVRTVRPVQNAAGP